ncbi:hypothetical protein [Aquimarina spinulae]|uniref:hypothetical protein n=1 Tax=Aquimarina spinulae TaxID=1192023 RepID=UPI000D552687|nr:hypothetical protein [Aquimarina spinulae]
MKKRIVTLLVFVGIVAFIIFSGCKKQKVDPAFDKTICMNYKEPVSKLSVKLVKEMITGYRDNQLKEINEEMHINDAHSIWFDLDTIKKFIYHIETTAKNNPNYVSNESGLGIRIYYANYPKRETWENEYQNDLSGFNNNEETMQYEHLHTLVMIPTIRRKVGAIEYNIDFDINDSRTYTTNLKYINGYFSNPDEETIPALTYSKSNRSGTIPNRNHGSLIPPRKTEDIEEAF